jgi:ATP-dependent Clp protease ATP-binding subunit ClpC
MFVPFNDAARLVMRLADEEASRYRHAEVRTEHLLLALLQLHDCVAARVLGKGRIDLEKVRSEVEKIATDGAADSSVDRRALTPGAQKAIACASSAAERLGHSQVGTGHLLLGLLEEAKGLAFRVLCRLGIGRVGANLSRVAERVIAEMNDGGAK